LRVYCSSPRKISLPGYLANRDIIVRRRHCIGMTAFGRRCY
jgi:hypothetical protein